MDYSIEWILSIIAIIVVALLVAIVVILILFARYETTVSITNVPPITSTMKEKAKQFNGGKNKVIIVGAGAAGMSAAYTLEYLGIDYIVLEANSDIGGRIKEIPREGKFFNNTNNVDADVDDIPSSYSLDLGPEWIQTNPKFLQDLLLFEDQRCNVETIEYQPQSFGFISGKRHDWMRYFYKEYKFLNSTWYSYFREYFYPYIAERIEFNAVVKMIDYSNDNSEVGKGKKGVMVTTQDGRSFVGSHIIVATPVSILQEKDIIFNPPLSKKKQNAIDEVFMAEGFKAFIEFDKRFYPDIQAMFPVWKWFQENDADAPFYYDALFGKQQKQHKKQSSNNNSNKCKNVLGCIHVGRTAYSRTVALDHDDDKILKSIIKELDDVFDNQASKHYVKSHIENWSANPYIKGAYSFEYDHDYEKILRPVNDKLYFCGEYLDEHNMATVHGAAISGRSVAQQLILDF